MLISTKGRYALRVLIDLAEQSDGEYVPLKDIAQRQEISQKYLESIMSALSKAGMVDGAHGKGGGYRLKKPAEEYSVKDILAVTETSLPMWKRLDSLLEDFFANINLAQIVQGKL